MGSINFKTSKIITLATKYININETDIQEYKKEYEEINDEILTDEKAETLLYNYMADCMQEDFDEIDNLIKSYDFEFYSVKVASGHYEGFQLLIDNVYLSYDTYKERQENQKELTQLKELLIKIIKDYGLRACYPSWCSGWKETEKETLKALRDGIKAERKAIKEKPYYKEYVNDFFKGVSY